MALLAGTLYDPASAASVVVSSLKAMTAIDTTNLRLTFTAPANGAVLVRLASGVSGGTSSSSTRYLLGVLDGATVRMRAQGIGGSFNQQAVTTGIFTQEAVAVVSGLTPSSSYTWDAAYGVENIQTSAVVKYGGPNDASGGDAWGGFAFEIWDAPNLLGSVLYDPSTAAGAVTTSLLAMTALDTTNARITFTAPASGKVFWRIRTIHTGTSTVPQLLFGILSSTTVMARIPPMQGMPQGINNSNITMDGSGVVTGLSGSYTWDAAYAVQVVAGAGGTLKWGGPNNTTANDAYSALAFEVWSA